MTERRLAIISTVGDPWDPKSWSFSPASILTELSQRDVPLTVFNATAPPSAALAGRLVNTLLGYGPRQWRRMGLARHWSRRVAARFAGDSGCRDFLHFGEMALPLPAPAPAQRHYLFIDTTFFHQATHSSLLDVYPKRFLDRMLAFERETLHQLSHIFVTADYVKRSMIEDLGVPGERVSNVGCGLGLVSGFEGKKDYRNGYLVFGASQRFNAKGGLSLIEGFEWARQRRPDLRLVVFGKPKDRDVRALLPRIERNPGIEFKDWNSPDYKEIFSKASLFVGPAEYEHFGKLYLEALVCRIPIIATRRCALPEFTQDGKFGFLIDDTRPETVGAAILEAMSDPDRLARMGKEGQRFVCERYTWQNVVDDMIEVIFGV